MKVEAWSFLVSRNQYIDYQTIVGPAFLREIGLSNLLARAAESDGISNPGEAFFRLIEGLKLGPITIVFQVVKAKEKDVNPEDKDTVLTDSFGREIYLTKGFVFRGECKEQDIKLCQTDIDSVYDRELEGVYRDFWKKDTTPTVYEDSKPFRLEEQNSEILSLKTLKPYQVPIRDPKLRKTIFVNYKVSSIAFSPVDKKIAIKGYNTLIDIYDNYGLNKDNKPIRQEGNKLTFRFPGFDFDIDKSVCFTPDGNFISYSTVVPVEKNVILIKCILHQTQKGKIEYSWGHSRLMQGRIHTIAISSDGKIMASADNSKDIILVFFKHKNYFYKLEKEVFLKHENEIKSFAMSPDSNTLAAGDCKGNILLWDLKNLQEIENNIPEQLQFKRISSLTFSPDGNSLAVAGDDKLCIWKLGTEQVVEIFHEQEFVNSIAYKPDDISILASGGKDNTIKLWNLEAEQKKLCTLNKKHSEEVTSVAFSYDGKFLASGSKDGFVRIWDTQAIII